MSDSNSLESENDKPLATKAKSLISMFHIWQMSCRLKSRLEDILHTRSPGCRKGHRTIHPRKGSVP